MTRLSLRGMQLRLPTMRLASVISNRYDLEDLFTTPAAAGFVSPRISEPGGGKLVRHADTGDNASFADDMLKIAAAVGDVDPAYYWTKSDDSGFTRSAGLALVAYGQNKPFVGWSNNTTLATSALLYGAKGRDAYAGGTAYSEALPADDVAHIIVLTETGAQHIVRHGTAEYLAFTYPAGSDATLYPALLGKVAQLESVYVYSVTPVTPIASLTTPAQGTEFAHSANAMLLEMQVTTLSTSADTVIVLYEQDAQNRLELYLTAGRRLSLYRRVDNTVTLVAHLSAAGAITDGSRIVIQWNAGGLFQTSGGSGTRAKAWVNTALGDTATTLPFATATAGRIQTKPAGTVFASVKTWGMVL